MTPKMPMSSFPGLLIILEAIDQIIQMVSISIDPPFKAYISESVFSGWTGRSTATESTWGSISAPSTKSISGKSKIRSHIVQKLSQDSTVTQSTEITVSSSDNYTDAERTQTIIRISAPSSYSMEENDRRYACISLFDCYITDNIGHLRHLSLPDHQYSQPSIFPSPKSLSQIAIFPPFPKSP